MSRGLSYGRVHRYRDMLTREVETRYINPEHSQDEIRRFRTALAGAIRHAHGLTEQAKEVVGPDTATIFLSHQLTLEDRTIIDKVEECILVRHINAEAAVREVFLRKEKELGAVNDAAIRSRLDDLRDMHRFVLRALLGREHLPIKELGGRLVVVADRILPSDILHLNSRNVAALISAKGSIHAHAAILARECSLPFIANVKPPIRAIPDGTEVIVDADTGRIVLNPHAEEVERCELEHRRRQQALKELVRNTRDLRLTEDDMSIRVLANTFVPNDVGTATQLGADGIGLYRLEAIYMSTHRAPSEKELYQFLRRSLEPMRGKPVTIRLLDVGGDKTLAYVPLAAQSSNPLGVRGIRLLLRHSDLIDVQLRVCLRLSAEYDISILLPMVTTADEIMHTRRLLNERMRILQAEGVPLNPDVPLGTMLETPAALLTFEELIDAADFVSLGTNDLVQFTMAADRDESEMAAYYHRGVHLLLPWLGKVLDVCAKLGKPCSLCGELATDGRYTKRLLALGLRDFSVVPYAVPKMKQHIAEIIEKHAPEARRSVLSHT